MTWHRAATAITAIALAISTAGCAAMFHGTTQTMSIRSNVDDAKLYVNETYIGTGNGVMTFKKNKNYIITARKDGYRDATVIPTKSFDAITLLGIFLDWGIISILVIDGAATGAWKQFDQTSYVLDPQPKGTSPQPTGVTTGAKPVNVQQETQMKEAIQPILPPQPTTNFTGRPVVSLTKFCPTCGQNASKDTAYCPDDGSELKLKK